MTELLVTRAALGQKLSLDGLSDDYANYAVAKYSFEACGTLVMVKFCSCL